MDVVANNIANVNTTGFKSARANFQDVLAQTIGRTEINTTQVGLGVTLAAIDNIHTQGPLQTTGRVLDLAIEGNGFFVVKPVDSSGTTIDNPMYTRDGTFYFDKDGYLVNAQGYRVQQWDGSAEGDIQLDGATGVDKDRVDTISVGTDGTITVTGTDSAGNPATSTFKIGIAICGNVESLKRVGNNLWDVTPGITDPDPLEIDFAGTNGRGIIRSGYLEMSNVDLAQEFTTMITTQRGYQANARIITTSDELLQELVNLKR